VNESLLAFLGYGFLLGMRHATDADHVIAVATIVSRRPELRAAASVGAAWGVGHTLTLLVVGGILAAFGLVVPAGVAALLELAVAVMLIALGILTLAGAPPGWARNLAPLVPRATAPRYVPAGALHRHVASLRQRPAQHAHVHAHGDYVHVHRHGHTAAAHGHAEDDTPPARLDRFLDSFRAWRLVRPFVVGSVHGLAGSAAVGLMVAATLDGPLPTLGYLLVFGAGTVAGMMLVTATLALPFTTGAARLPQVNEMLRIGSGVLSVVFGVWLAWQAATGQPLR
jgi:high-affinity nickel-transport protein